MTARIQIKNDEMDRTVEVLVDGKSVGRTDYDESGWCGMGAMVTLARNMAKALDVSIEEG